MTFNQILSWRGELQRRDYTLWGIILFTIKYNLDRLIAIFFGKYWIISDYFIVADRARVLDLSAEDRYFYLTLLLFSLPFIWFGTILCVKRLRNAGLPEWTVVFFFLPFINLILFVILASLPERDAPQPTGSAWIDKFLPQSRYGAALMAIGIVVIVCMMFTWVLVYNMREYGWSVFAGIPFFLGFGTVLIFGRHRSITYRQALNVSLIAVSFFCVLIFILALEGIICILMGFPIMFLIAWIGASVAFVIHRGKTANGLNVFVAPIVMVAVLGLIEHFENPVPPSLSVSSSVVIDAAPQKVWDQLVAFTNIGEPDELIFKTGIAYPTHAEIQGTGVGAIRRCNFTTGAFIEPIIIWDEPHRLQFGVLDQPPPLHELTIYKDVEMAHMENYFVSEKGQFLLEQTADGKTKLTGTTWYHHNVWPTFYWSLWSDYILHKIHLRVLHHIKEESEISKGN